MSVDISFPVLCFIKGKVTVHTESSFNAMSARFLDKDTLVTMASLRSKARDGWILDSCGAYYSICFKGHLREWARPLSFLWNAVLDKYELQREDAVTVGYMLQVLEGMSKTSMGSLGLDFKRFLTGLDPEERITREILNTWPL